MLKDTLEMVHFDHCNNVEGEFMCLADFPRLKWLNLKETAVRGDIRNISEDDFASIINGKSRPPKSGLWGGGLRIAARF